MGLPPRTARRPLEERMGNTKIWPREIPACLPREEIAHFSRKMPSGPRNDKRIGRINQAGIRGGIVKVTIGTSQKKGKPPWVLHHRELDLPSTPAGRTLDQNYVVDHFRVIDHHYGNHQLEWGGLTMTRQESPRLPPPLITPSHSDMESLSSDQDNDYPTHLVFRPEWLYNLKATLDRHRENWRECSNRLGNDQLIYIFEKITTGRSHHTHAISPFWFLSLNIPS